MFRLSRTPGSPAILAIVYADGGAAGSFIANLGYRLRDAGVAVAGIVPYRSSTPRTGKCGVEVEELASRLVLQLSEDENPQPFGCRIDPEAISEAAALISSSLRKAPNVVIFNKFGKLEAEGGGLRETIAEAIQLGIPVIAGVPRRHVGTFRQLTEGLAEESPVELAADLSVACRAQDGGRLRASGNCPDKATSSAPRAERRDRRPASSPSLTYRSSHPMT